MKARLLALLLTALLLLAPCSLAEDDSLILSPGTYDIGTEIPAGTWLIQPAEGEVLIITLSRSGKQTQQVILTGFGYSFRSQDVMPSLDASLAAGHTLTITGGEAILTPSSEAMVWVSGQGKRYHRIADCSNMKNPQHISESDAIASGRTPCANCWD